MNIKYGTFHHCLGVSNVLLLTITSTIFINDNPQDKSLITAASEAKLAHHAALRDISLKMAACSSKMTLRSFDLTFNFSERSMKE